MSLVYLFAVTGLRGGFHYVGYISNFSSSNPKLNVHLSQSKAPCLFMYNTHCIAGSHHRELQLQSCWIHHSCSPETHTHTHIHTFVFRTPFSLLCLCSGITSVHVPALSKDLRSFRNTHSNRAVAMAAQSFLLNHSDLLPFLLSPAQAIIMGRTIGSGSYGSIEEIAIPIQEYPGLFSGTDAQPCGGGEQVCARWSA